MRAGQGDGWRRCVRVGLVRSTRLVRPSLLVSALLILPGAGEAAQPPASGACVPGGSDVSPDEGKDPGACSLPGLPQPTQALGAPEALAEADSDTDITHYFLDLEVIPEYDQGAVSAVRVAGVNTIDFEPTVDGLTTFTLDLQSALTVNAVTGSVASWLRIGDTIEITLDRAYDAGEPVQVAVDYDGIPLDAGFGSFRWWLRNGELVVATLSEPFYARTWWPCKDSLDDKATMQMHVTVPSGMVALSNGIEMGSQALPGNRTRYLWHETRPMIPYLASLAISGYERYELQYDYDAGGTPASMSVPCYVYPDHWDYSAGEPQAAHKTGCDELPGMLGTFAGLFGEYPFVDEKYGVVETGGTGGLVASMEHQTLSSMWRLNSYSDIMAHELAHQWWGDEVTCQTWYDIWLNEGFASYGEALYREFRSGGSASLYWNRMNARRPANPDAQVYRTTVASLGNIFSTNDVYNKGAWVLHMLRHVLGDPAFLTFLADYRADFADDSATTDEFTASLSASFGEDLAWFSDQWVLGPGSPDYEWNYAVEAIGGQTVVKLAVWQRQDLDGFGLFSMPIDVAVTTASGTSVQRVWNDDWSEYYVLPVDGPVLGVAFDETEGDPTRNWVLSDGRAQVATPLTPPPVVLAADVTLPPAAGAPTTVVLTFSEDIGDVYPADLELAGSASGIHAPDVLSYDPVARQASVSWASLPADAYVLSVFDTGVFANGKPLDGETDELAWWDDVSLPSGDGQPGGDATLAFDIGWSVCADGLDNDADGYTDFPTDPACRDAAWNREASRCQDGVNNDGAPGTDFDGGESILGVGNGDPNGADPECVQPYRNSEAPSSRCGLGAELAFALLAFRRLRRRHGLR